MINLLPPDEKEKLHLKKKKKVAIILGITFIIPLVCMVMVLVSLRLYILGEIKGQNVVLEQARLKYQTPDFLAFKDIIKNDNALLTQIDAFYKKETYTSQALKTIASIKRPQELYFTGLFLQRDSNQKIRVVAAGWSASRDNVLILQKNLQENEHIENVSFLPQSWVDAKNVKFNLTFGIK
jgi:hypothetical protein